MDTGENTTEKSAAKGNFIQLLFLILKMLLISALSKSRKHVHRTMSVALV
jgi:hypothetical protein